MCAALFAQRVPAQSITSSSAPLSGHLDPLTPSGLQLVTPYARVTRGYNLHFPDDEGSHPAFRTEWWYITGWLEARGRAPFGFQVTFFRARPEIDDRNPSAFTP